MWRCPTGAQCGVETWRHVRVPSFCPLRVVLQLLRHLVELLVSAAAAAQPQNMFGGCQPLAVGEAVVLLTPPPSTFSRCFNSDGERASAK